MSKKEKIVPITSAATDKGQSLGGILKQILQKITT